MVSKKLRKLGKNKRAIAIVFAIGILLTLLSPLVIAMADRFDNNVYTLSWSGLGDIPLSSGSQRASLGNLSYSGGSTQALCADLNKSASGGTKYHAYTLDDNGSVISNPGKVRWIVKHSTLNGHVSLSSLESDRKSVV